jgi:hypothetical protein
LLEEVIGKRKGLRIQLEEGAHQRMERHHRRGRIHKAILRKESVMVSG